MKIAVIVDSNRVSKWQYNTLSQLKNCDETAIYNCTNTRPSSKRLRNAFYYGLNLFAIRNGLTRPVAVTGGALPITSTIDFASDYEGLWQHLPDSLVRRIEADKPDVILKFGMGLLSVPPELPCPILSYHHGDPDHFRGGPAGFYELFHGAPVMGQIVQILSNQLDMGRVVAFAETKIHRHSYRSTLMEAYRHSPLLMNAAIANALSGTIRPKISKGKNYRLPDNKSVALFVLRSAWRSLRRLSYGAFFEKAWQVSRAPADPQLFASATDGTRLPARSQWKQLSCPPRYSFIADPFFDPSGDGVLVEGLNRSTGGGEILQLRDDRATKLSVEGGHYSYPGSVSDGGEDFLIPEVAHWSEPKIFRIGAEGLSDVGLLDVPGRPRLLDPTLVWHQGRLFLFANIAAEGSNILRLWRSDSLFGRFAEHPSSPIRISPQGARMAGEILSDGSSLIRLGQDFRDDYGNGLFLFRLEALDPETYREKCIGEARFADVKGPHTLNFRKGEAVFDWYRDRFSPLAGIRRMSARGRSNGRSLERAWPPVGDAEESPARPTPARPHP